MSRSFVFAIFCALLACGWRPQAVAPAQTQHYGPWKESYPIVRNDLKFTPPSTPHALAVIKAAREGPPGPPNDVIVHSREAQADAPVTVSRFFARGEIARCPQAQLDGKALETQCDVKTRWPDGSVQHSLVTFRLPLERNGKRTVHFVDQAPPPAAGLTKEQMLGFLGGAWGAAMEFTVNTDDGPQTHTVNVKDILKAWDGKAGELGVRYWMQGSLATQVIVEDRSLKLPFDFGWEPTVKHAWTSSEFHPKELGFEIQEESTGIVGDWTLPAQVYINSELFEICSMEGRKVRVCPQGRPTPVAHRRGHRANRPLVPNWGWKKAVSELHRSLHPVFVLTFHRDWPGVKVEYVVENTWLDRRQDQAYTYKLLRGQPLTEAAPERAIVHSASSRWRQAHWSGKAAPDVNIDYNFPYVIHSRAVPSFDVTRKVPDQAIEDEWRNFAAGDRGEPMGRAGWELVFEAPGGRADIGLFPRWDIRYLYTFDARLRAVVQGSAAASGHVPIHYRESRTGRAYCDKSCASSSPDGFGRIVSLDARPTICLGLITSYDQRPEDVSKQVGVVTYGDWGPELAHMGDFAYVAYLTSGDWYLLEELRFWAAWAVGFPNPADVCNWCRHLDFGYTFTEVRGMAWALRALAEAAVMSPEGTPEKEYFTAKFNNQVAVWEGRFDIKTGSFYEPCPPGKVNAGTASRWCWGRTNFVTAPGPNPLYAFDRMPGEPMEKVPAFWSQSDFGRDGKLPRPGAVAGYGGFSEWMHQYHYIVTGHALDLGLDQVAEVHARSITRLLALLRNPKYNPYLVGAYVTPEFRCAPKYDAATGKTICTPGGYMTDLAEVLAVFKDEKDNPGAQVHKNVKDFSTNEGDAQHGYAQIARGAAALLVGLEWEGMSGREAWEWINPKVTRDVQNDDPRWAFVPRASNDLVAAHRDRASGRVAAAPEPESPKRDKGKGKKAKAPKER